MRRAILHIGTPKTGTKTIQAFLAENRQEIAFSGYHVPRIWGANHYGLTILSYDSFRWDALCGWTAQRLGQGGAKPNRKAWLETRAILANEWRQIAQEQSENVLLLSNEHLYERLRTEEDISCLSRNLREAHLDPEFVLYVRDPLSHAISALSTAVKSGEHISTLSVPDAGLDIGYDLRSTGRPPPWHFLHYLPLWESVFPGKIHVRLYDPQNWPQGDLLQDFCQHLGLPWRDSFAVPSRQNESVSWSLMRILNELNAVFPLLTPDGSFNQRRRNLTKVLTEMDVSKQYYQPSVAEISSYNNWFLLSNEWLRTRYFVDRVSLWTTPRRARKASSDHLFESRLTYCEKEFVRRITRCWDSGDFHC